MIFRSGLLNTKETKNQELSDSGFMNAKEIVYNLQ